MLSAEAGAYQRPFGCLWIVHGELAIGSLQWRDLRRRMISACLTVIRILCGPDSRREPHASFLIDERIMDARVAIPDRVVAPVWRASSQEIQIGRSLWIAVGMLYLCRFIGNGIQDRHHVGALFRRVV